LRGRGGRTGGKGEGRGREKERGREGGKRRAPKLLFNQGPSQPCYATADESLLY